MIILVDSDVLRKMKSVLKNRKILKKLSKLSSERVKIYDWSVIVDKYINLYYQLIKKEFMTLRKYSKSSSFYLNTKKNFFENNKEMLNKVTEQNLIYTKQIRRKNVKKAYLILEIPQILKIMK